MPWCAVVRVPLVSRKRYPFNRNGVCVLHATLWPLWDPGQVESRLGSGVLVTIKSVYGMDGTVSPFRAMLDAMREVFLVRNAHLIVD